MRDYDGKEMIVRETNKGKYQVLPENHTAYDLSVASCFNTREQAEAYINRPMPEWLRDERARDIEREKYYNQYAEILALPQLREMRRNIQELYQRASWESKLAYDAQRAAARGAGKVSCIGRDIGAVRQEQADYQAGDASRAWGEWAEASKQYEMELQSLMIEAQIPVELFRSLVSDDDTLTCFRCGHSWKKRRDNEPKFCPKCNSPYWNKQRRD